MASRSRYGDYQQVEVDLTDPDRHDVSDTNTLADDEIPLTNEELAAHDPLGFDDEAQKVMRGRTPWSILRRGWWSSSAPYAEKDDRFSAESNARLSKMTPWLIFLLPSWMHPAFGFVAPNEPRRATDYLDGLRGVASLFVFFDHYLLGGMDEVAAFGFGSDGHWYIVQLPFLRTVFSGAAMVSIFFVISGYVLSARSIIAMRAGRQDKVHHTLTSMTFRRALRLFLPSLAASSFTLTCVLLGLRYTMFPRHWTVMKELHGFVLYLRDFLFNLTWQDPLSTFNTPQWRGWYGGQLWTIPREFTCSLILFVVLYAVARCKPAIRLTIAAVLGSYAFYDGRWDVACFIAGMLLSELNIIAGDRKLPAVARLLLWALLIAGWYLTGFPQIAEEHTPGYSFLVTWWDAEHLFKWRFWLGWSGILVVGSLSFLEPAQRAFTTPIARYLGRISYALYLVHALMNATLRPIFWRFFRVLPHPGAQDNPLSWGWLLATLLYVPCVLWVADIFWRLVDGPAVRFAKWVEQKCFLTDHE